MNECEKNALNKYEEKRLSEFPLTPQIEMRKLLNRTET